MKHYLLDKEWDALKRKFKGHNINTIEKELTNELKKKKEAFMFRGINN